MTRAAAPSPCAEEPRVQSLRTIARLNRPGRFRPEVHLVEVESDSGPFRAVLKDFGRLEIPRAARVFLASREAKAYSALAGVEEVPRLLARPGPAALLLEWRDALPLLPGSATLLGEAFFDDLSVAVARIHERGVVHLDLRERRNVLVDRSGRPVIVDFTASLVAGRRSPLRIAARLLRVLDRAAVLKHRRRLRPAGMTVRDRLAERFFGALGRLWRAVRLH